MKRFSLLSLLLLSASLAACSDNSWFGDKERPPLPGERISALDFEKDLKPEGAGATPFENAAIVENTDWPQAGGHPAHVMGNLALSENALKKVWSADIGEGSRGNLPLTAQPVVGGESIFTLDTDSAVSAFDLKSGDRRWRTDIRDVEEEDPVIAGGIALFGGLIYATAGYDELVCLDAVKGDIKWRAKLSGPSRAAPTVLGNKVYVTTLANSILALDAADGKVLWEFSGLAASTGLIGAASPAATEDLVVPAFSSGEVYALRAANGSVAWSDNLAGTLRLGGLTALSDIRGLPVIADNIVYAVSFGGKAAAIDLLTGARVWQKEISGSKTPLVSGNRVFLISSDARIVSLDRESGDVAWVSQLARYKDKNRREPILWTGPIMAGNRLMAFSSDGRVAEIDPAQGTLIREWDSGEDVRIAPVIAGGTLYLLSEDGDLIAYR
jgi:outer membrane protein assembly factor BamB